MLNDFSHENKMRRNSVGKDIDNFQILEDFSNLKLKEEGFKTIERQYKDSLDNPKKRHK